MHYLRNLIARAARKPVLKVRHYEMTADKPFHTVATDVKVVNTTSLSGCTSQLEMHFMAARRRLRQERESQGFGGVSE